FAVRMLHQLHRVTATPGESAVAALEAGLDVELPMTECFAPGLLEALASGAVDPATIDRAVPRVLRLNFAPGLFEQPFADEGAIELDRPADRALARTVAEESIVLLANDGTLPIADGARRGAVGPERERHSA